MPPRRSARSGHRRRKNESWNIELFEVFREVRLGKGLDTVVVRLHSLQPPVLSDAFRYLGARPIVAVKRKGDVLVKLRSIFRQLGAEAVEDRHGRAPWILVRLHHQRRYRADEHGHGDALRTAPPEVPGNFSAANGMAHMNSVPQVKLLSEGCEIVGISVHIIAVPGLAGTAVPPPVMRDDSVATMAKEQHLSVQSSAVSGHP